MDNIIKDAERFDLSGADIHRITDGKCNIIQYSDLERVNNLEEILSPHGAVMILYTTKKNFGHWVCLFKINNNKLLEFFDPYGLKIDEELQITNDLHLRDHNGIITPHLSALVNSGGYRVLSNTYQIQEFLEHTNTCGRHTGMRVRFRDTPLKKYIKLMTTNKYNADWMVSAMTLMI